MAEQDKRVRMKMSTRPQDWAASQRAHLFGLSTLSVTELHGEIERHAAYRRDAAIMEAQRELRQRQRG